MSFGRKFSVKLVLTFCAVAGLTLAFADFLILRGLHDRLVGNLRENLIRQTRQLSLFVPATYIYVSSSNFPAQPGPELPGNPHRLTVAKLPLRS